MQDFIIHLHSAWSQTWKAYPRWSGKQTTSEDEAKAMLDSGEVKAAVIIPEGMIHTIMSGTNDLPARIIYPGEPSIETVIFVKLLTVSPRW